MKFLFKTLFYSLAFKSARPQSWFSWLTYYFYFTLILPLSLISFYILAFLFTSFIYWSYFYSLLYTERSLYLTLHHLIICSALSFECTDCTCYSRLHRSVKQPRGFQRALKIKLFACLETLSFCLSVFYHLFSRICPRNNRH